MHAIQLQGRAVHWREDRWVFGFTAGNGWFTFDGVGEGSLRGTYPYVEHAVLDKYDLQSGAYLGSQELPGPATRFAGHGDVLFIIDTFGLLPIVTSLRARAPGD